MQIIQLLFFALSLFGLVAATGDSKLPGTGPGLPLHTPDAGLYPNGSAVVNGATTGIVHYTTSGVDIIIETHLETKTKSWISTWESTYTITENGSTVTKTDTKTGSSPSATVAPPTDTNTPASITETPSMPSITAPPVLDLKTSGNVIFYVSTWVVKCSDTKSCEPKTVTNTITMVSKLTTVIMPTFTRTCDSEGSGSTCSDVTFITTYTTISLCPDTTVTEQTTTHTTETVSITATESNTIKPPEDITASANSTLTLPTETTNTIVPTSPSKISEVASSPPTPEPTKETPKPVVSDSVSIIPTIVTPSASITLSTTTEVASSPPTPEPTKEKPKPVESDSVSITPTPLTPSASILPTPITDSILPNSTITATPLPPATTASQSPSLSVTTICPLTPSANATPLILTVLPSTLSTPLYINITLTTSTIPLPSGETGIPKQVTSEVAQQFTYNENIYLLPTGNITFGVWPTANSGSAVVDCIAKATPDAVVEANGFPNGENNGVKLMKKMKREAGDIHEHGDTNGGWGGNKNQKEKSKLRFRGMGWRGLF